ncbi:MAG: streptogrisin [Actinoplanes sp.]|nr:streptogrisin [Actinoplanes sp.]
MIYRSRKLLVISAAAGAAVAVTPFAGFAGTDPAPTPARTADAKSGLAPGMVAAMRRDLHLSDDQITTRLAMEAGAPVVQRSLKNRLGAAYAGAWIPDGATKLTVAVTDPALAAQVRAEGADAKVVKRNQADLDRARTALDKRAAQAGNIRGWYADVETNSVVVLAAPGGEAAAAKFAQDSGAGAVTVRTEAARPHPVDDIRGGDQYYSVNLHGLCSVGFAVTGGFVSAGHCGKAGDPTLGYNNAPQGTFAASEWPGNDFSWIRTNSSWTSEPWVNNYEGSNTIVTGSQDAAIGSSICRSGRTTHWRCGTLLGRDETANYPAGPVTGLSHMSACAEPGDSGGSVISGTEAQGVASGVVGDCSSGGTTWFQPVNEILHTYGLTLTTRH